MSFQKRYKQDQATHYYIYIFIYTQATVQKSEKKL